MYDVEPHVLYIDGYICVGVSSAWGLALFVRNELGNARAFNPWSEQ